MKKLIFKLSLVLSTLLFVPSVMATNFSYSNFVLSGERLILKKSSNLSSEERTVDGVNLKVGYEWAPSFFSRFEVRRQSYDAKDLNMGFTATTVGFGLGTAKAITETLDVYALITANQSFFEVKTNTQNSFDDLYLGGELGFRNWLTPNVEFNSAIIYNKGFDATDLLKATVHAPIGVGFWLVPNAAIHLKYIISEDFYGASLGYEYRF